MTPTEKHEGYRTANEMADRQREISVSEFFLKNCHLLGFDSGAKALVTTVKEAVDNALDACEEAGILPDIRVEVFDEEDGEFRVAVEDNGPGIVENQITRIFGKLLYGSKFHKLSQSREQQGMGGYKGFLDHGVIPLIAVLVISHVESLTIVILN